MPVGKQGTWAADWSKILRDLYFQIARDLPATGSKLQMELPTSHNRVLAALNLAGG